MDGQTFSQNPGKQGKSHRQTHDHASACMMSILFRSTTSDLSLYHLLLTANCSDANWNNLWQNNYGHCSVLVLRTIIHNSCKKTKRCVLMQYTKM